MPDGDAAVVAAELMSCLCSPRPPALRLGRQVSGGFVKTPPALSGWAKAVPLLPFASVATLSFALGSGRCLRFVGCYARRDGTADAHAGGVDHQRIGCDSQ